jgi:hypothetical protein
MTNLNNYSGLRAAFIDHLNTIYFEGYAETLNSEDFDFLFNEFKNA